jgi:tol-pal system protein YbgF
MKHTFQAGTAALLFVLSAGAPDVAAQSRETRQLMADIRILQIQAQELQTLIASLNQSMNDAIKTLTARVGEQGDANRKAFADQKLTIDAVSNDLRVLRERVDDGSVRIGTLSQEVDSLRELVTSLRAAPAAAGSTDPSAAAGASNAASAPGAAATDAAAPTAQTATPSPAAAIGMSPDRFWTAVMDDYYRGDYDIAVMGFEQYVRAFPTGARAVEAQVNIGHCYMLQGKYEQAIEAYDTAIRNYPSSDAIAEAYVKKGEAHFNLKQPDSARDAWQHVLKTYPDSNAALLAKQRLPVLQ